MIGFGLVSPWSDQWATITRRANDPTSWQVTFGDARGPSGHTVRATPHAALRVALDDRLVLREVDGGPEADAIAAEVHDWRGAFAMWADSDLSTEPPAFPPWTDER